MKNAIAMTFIVVLGLQVLPATASDFESYEECILEKMQGVSSDAAAKAIQLACRKLTAPPPKERECVAPLMGPDVPDIESPSLGFEYWGDYMVLDFYNPSHTYTVTKIALVARFDTENDGLVQREFTEDVYAPPQSTGKFRVNTGVPREKIKERGLEWRLKFAIGCK